MKDETSVWVFSSEFYKIFTNIFSAEHLQATASETAVRNTEN